jgi:AcrR family transcriptional regulator
VPRAKERTPALRERILTVALSTLTELGPSGFTARHIAAGADTSVPAVYELFGNKTGLVRNLFFTGFQELGERLSELTDGPDQRADVAESVRVARSFATERGALWEVMFSRPFADFDPGPDEVQAGRAVREHITARVQRVIDTGAIEGNATDIAHLLLALVQGLVAQESAGWLGTSRRSVDRRWDLAATRFLAAFAPDPPVAG